MIVQENRSTLSLENFIRFLIHQIFNKIRNYKLIELIMHLLNGIKLIPENSLIFNEHIVFKGIVSLNSESTIKLPCFFTDQIVIYRILMKITRSNYCENG